MTNKMNHPLTDDIAESIAVTDLQCPFGIGELVFTHADMRSAADWQLERVIEWIKQGHLYDLEYHTHCLDMIADLRKAMRPQENN